MRERRQLFQSVLFLMGGALIVMMFGAFAAVPVLIGVVWIALGGWTLWQLWNSRGETRSDSVR